MKLCDIIECANCDEADAPSPRGTCRTCGSASIRWVVGQQNWQPEPVAPTPILSGIDKEILREIGVAV